MKPASKLLLRALKGAGLVLVFLSASVAALLVHLNLPRGRRVVAALLTQALNSEFSGSFVIGRIERVSPGGLRGADIVVRDPSGRVVLTVAELSVSANLVTLAENLLGRAPTLLIPIDYAWATRAEAHWYENSDGVSSIQLAFTPRPTPVRAGQHAPSRDVRVQLRGLELSRGVARGAPAGLPPLELQVRRVVASLDASKERVDLQLQRFGVVLRGLAAQEIRGVGNLRFRDPGALELSLDGFVGDVALSSTAALQSGVLTAHADLPRASPAAVRALWPAWPLARDVALALDVHGKLPELRVEAQATSGASRLSLSGPLRTRPELSSALSLRGKALDLSLFGAALPASAIDWQAQLELSLPANGLRAQALGSTEPTALFAQDIPATEFSVTYADGAVAGKALLREPNAPVQTEFKLSPNGAFDLVADTRALRLEQSARLRRYSPGSGSLAAHVQAHVEQRVVGANFNFAVRDFARAGLTAETLTVTGSAKGPLDRPQALQSALHVTGKDLRWGYFAFVEADAKISGPLAAPKISVALKDLRGATVELGARAHFDQGGLGLSDGELSVKRGDATISGKVERFELGEQSLRIEHFDFRGLGGSLVGSAEVRPQLVSLNAVGHQLDLGGIARVVGLPTHYLQGKLELTADAVVASDIQKGTLSFELNDGSLGPLAGVHSEFHAELQDRLLQGELGLQLDQLASAAARFKLELAGGARELSALKDAVGSVELSLHELDLGLLGRALTPGSATPLRGSLAAELRAQRSRAGAWPSLELAARTNELAIDRGLLWSSAPAIAGIDVQLGSSLDGDTGASELSLKLLDARGDLASGSAAFSLNLAQLWRDPVTWLQELRNTPIVGKVLVEDRNLSDLPDGIPLVDKLSGRLRVEASLAGTPSAPAISGRIRLAQLEGEEQAGTHPIDACLNLGWEHQSARFGSSGELFLSDRTHATCAGTRIAQYSLNGALLEQTQPDAPPRFRGSGVASLEGVPLDALPGLADSGVTGQLSGRISLTQERDVPVLSANLSSDDVALAGTALGQGKLELRSNERILGANLELTRSHSQLLVNALLGLDTSGALPRIASAEPLSLRIVAKQADASLLQPFARDLLSSITGRFDSNVILVIPLEPAKGQTARQQAQLRGDFALHGGALELSRVNAKLRQVELAARADSDNGETRIQVDKLEARGAEARQTVRVHDGRLWLDGFTISRIQALIDANELPLVLEGVPQAIATTRQSIQLDVRRTPSEMQANLRIPYLTVALPQALGRDLISLDNNHSIEVLQPLGEPLAAVVAGLPWRLTLQFGQQVKVTRSDLDLPLSGTLEILLRDQTEVSGEIELDPGGRVEVSGKTFVIDNGQVHFTSEADNPRLNVTAQWRAPDGSPVIAQVTGTLKKPELALSSPGRTREETLALLLGGSGGGGGEGVGQQATSSAVVGADQILSPMLANTPLRNVEIRTGSEKTADQRSYSTYVAAVPISDSVWFEGSYKTLNSTDPSEQSDAWSGTVDWRFRRNWSLRTEVGKIGTGVDLSWNYRY